MKLVKSSRPMIAAIPAIAFVASTLAFPSTSLLAKDVSAPVPPGLSARDVSAPVPPGLSARDVSAPVPPGLSARDVSAPVPPGLAV